MLCWNWIELLHLKANATPYKKLLDQLVGHGPAVDLRAASSRPQRQWYATAKCMYYLFFKYNCLNLSLSVGLRQLIISLFNSGSLTDNA